MVSVKYFKTTRKSHRFNKNQKVWIAESYGNYMSIYYQFRGSGRYVHGDISKKDTVIGEIKEIEVDDEFAKRIRNRY